MNMRTKVRGLAVAVALVGGLAAIPAWAQGLPPPPDIPPPEAPPAVEGLLAGASPTVWAACDLAGTVAFLTAFSSSLVPAVPLPPGTLPASPGNLVADASSYVNALRRPCLVVPFPDPTPTCSLDAQPASVPFLGQRPGGVTVNQVAAIELLLTELGIPAGNTASGAVASAASCA